MLLFSCLQEKRTERTNRTSTAVTVATGNVTKTRPSSSPTVTSTAYSTSTTGTAGRTTHISSPVHCSTPIPAARPETARTQRSRIRNQRLPETRLCSCTTVVRTIIVIRFYFRFVATSVRDRSRWTSDSHIRYMNRFSWV